MNSTSKKRKTGIAGHSARAFLAAMACILAGLCVPGLHPTQAEAPKGDAPARPVIDRSRHLAVVNQVGYQTAWPKRFTAPLSADGDTFIVRLKEDPSPLFTGVIKDHAGDFSAFQPADSAREYVIVLKGGSLGEFTSDAFAIRKDLWREQFWQAAIDFMIDSRSVVGTHPSAYGGSPWRDGTYYDFISPSLLLMYLADPAKIEAMPHQVDCAADKARVLAPDFKFDAKNPMSDGVMDAVKRYYTELEAPKADAPDVVKLVHWGLGYFLMKPVQHDPSGDPLKAKIHGQMVEQFAYLLWAWPKLKLDRWLPESFRQRCMEFVKANWESSGLLGVDPMWDSKTFVSLNHDFSKGGTSYPHPYKARNAPGHSIMPNLMMYELALQAKDPAAARYLTAAKEQAAWIIANVDVKDPRTTKGMRMSEHRTIPSLVWFLQNHPEAAPAGLKEYIAAWARVMIDRSANMWDFRRFDLGEHWSLPGANEPGNLAGFPACALAASWVVDDATTMQRLREIAVAQFDNLFGRNPMLAACPNHAEKGFPLVERSWPNKFPPNKCARLETCRGALCASPGSEMYPFKPDGKFRHSEGWVNFNAAWNVSLAYFVWDSARQAPPVDR